MDRKKNNTKKNKTAVFFLWTIRNQGFLSYHIQVYMYTAVGIILLLTLANKIALEAALQAIFYGGTFICGLIWILIERRRSWLMKIDDPALKEAAHNTMLAYIYTRLPKSKREHLYKKNSCPTC